MKKALIIFLILTINFSAKAECTFSGINVWPSQQNIATNSILVIEGYSQSQELIRQLNKRNKIYLTCNSERIQLKVLKILEGQYSLTQAILKAESELTKGKTYELHIDNLGMFDKDEYKVAKWTVNSDADIEKPIWDCEPIYKGQNYTAYGCGPAKYVNFCGSFIDKSQTLVYAKVFDKTKKSSSDYFLTTENQKISIGHGMCSGEFSFDKGTNYEVQYGLMDASGNKNEMLTEPISFTSPTEKNQANKQFNCNCNKNSKLKSLNDFNNNLKLPIYALITIGVIGIGIFIYRKQKIASS